MGRGRHVDYLEAAHECRSAGGFLIWLGQNRIDALLDRVTTQPAPFAGWAWPGQKKAPRR